MFLKRNTSATFREYLIDQLGGTDQKSNKRLEKSVLIRVRWILRESLAEGPRLDLAPAEGNHICYHPN